MFSPFASFLIKAHALFALCDLRAFFDLFAYKQSFFVTFIARCQVYLFYLEQDMPVPCQDNDGSILMQPPSPNELHSL